MLYGVYANESFKRQIEYIFNLVFSIYGIRWQMMLYAELAGVEIDPRSLVISYGKEKPEGTFAHQIHIYESPLFGPNYLKPNSMPKAPLSHFQDLPIIYAGNGNLPDWVVVRKNNVGRKVIETNIDIIASSFFMLTRYEEVLINARDKFDRFPAKASLAYKEGFLGRPIVNEYIELLWSWIGLFHLGFKRKSIWSDKDFAVCLTYDVDVVRKYDWYPPLRAITSLTLKHGEPKRSLAVARDYLEVMAKLKTDPYDKFDYLMSLLERYGFEASFYFMSGGKTNYDKHYQANSPHIVSLMRKMQKKGFEIGLHTSFDAYNNSAMIVSEKERLEKILGNPILGARQHYLRWKIPESWRAREKSGLKYDTSVSFPEREGFRAGICLPYKPFDLHKSRVLDIWELSLTVMDSSLYTYQKVSSEEALQRIKNLVEAVKRYRGIFVILWHNSSFDELSWPGWGHIYIDILEHLGEQNIFNSTALEIIQRWEDEIPS